MKTCKDYEKEAEAASLETLGEVNKDFIIGYLSKALEILNQDVKRRDKMLGINQGEPPAPSDSLAKHAGVVPDAVSDNQELICGSLKPIK